jgi:GntR family transcriptional regulator/MocR family aminotransferase
MYVDPAQVIIGAGSQILYAAIIQLLGRDKIYAAENPGYPLLKKIYELNGAKFAQINIDAEGISVDELSDVGAHVAHVMPQHHLPTGIVMSAPRRTQLLAWEASSPEHYIIEDDYDCELRFAGRPITPLAANDPTGRVIYTNTFTKTMGNVFRVGYMVLPPALLTKFYDMLGFYSPTVGILDQLTLADFIDSGAYTRHVRRVRTRLKKATQVFVDTLQNFPTTQSPDFIPVFHAEGVGAGAHFSLHASNTGAKALKSTRDTARQFGVNIKMISDYILENNAINDTKLYTNTYIIDCSQASVESAKGAAKAILENL